ncbi:hypothetical protein MUG84_12755 [Paenibacillus sp. KQZ6P-2]|uniref:ABC transmembrane type-1 domain-containing protein n=1 Tax=Paenibacillus mangrovi TaxID=2931978 RepID=A0A9X2B5F0_9BACL|nr:hypothetical protein [Paenibacillus mangrovi]MCJ8012602.1 hypothetical protein [Paenibacillus mangrovi]
MTIKSAKLADLYKDYECFHRDVTALPAFARSGGVTAIGESAFSVWIHPVNRVMAGALLSILPILALYLFTQRYFVESVERTGIAGD